MVKMHTLLYKYKKYGTEMLAEANFHERVVYLRQADDLKENENDHMGSKLMMAKYDSALKADEVDANNFVMCL